MAGKRSRESSALVRSEKKRNSLLLRSSYFVTSLDHLENSRDVREQGAAGGREIPESSGAVWTGGRHA